jgi:polyisoprenoid-binding protein YceI
MRAALSLLLVALSAVYLHAAEAPLDVPASSLTFMGHATLHDFHGQAQAFQGHAEVDAADPNLVRHAVIDLAADRLTTFQTTRDKNMRAWLHVDSEPEIRFDLTKLTRLIGDPAHATANSPATFAVQGNFTLNHVTKPLNARVSGWRSGRQLVVDGKTTIDTTQFGLPIITQFVLTVDKNVDVAFHLVFDLPPGMQSSRAP